MTLQKLTTVPLALITIFFLAFSMLAALPASASDDDEGLYISVEEHGGVTHVHVKVDNEQIDSFFLEAYELDETDEIIEAIAEKTDYTVAEVEAAAHFKNDDEDEDEDEREHGDDHDDEDEDEDHHDSDHDDDEHEDDHKHGLDNATDKIQTSINAGRDQQMQALLKVLQQLIALLTQQLEAKIHEVHDHATHDHDDDDSDDDEHESEHDEHMDMMDDSDDDDPYAGLHIMADGSIMLGDGSELTDATITDDGKIELADGTILEPEFDLR